MAIKQTPGLRQSVGDPQNLLGRLHRHDSIPMKRCRLGSHINDVRACQSHLQRRRRHRRCVNTAGIEKTAAVAETLRRKI